MPRSKRNARQQYGLLVDTARPEPAIMQKHSRPVSAMATEVFQRLKALEHTSSCQPRES